MLLTVYLSFNSRFKDFKFKIFLILLIDFVKLLAGMKISSHLLHLMSDKDIKINCILTIIRGVKTQDLFLT